MDSSTKQQAEGNWKQFKGKIQETWGDLTDDEMDRFEGKRKRFEGYLEEQTGEKREDVKRKIDKASQEAKYTF